MNEYESEPIRGLPEELPAGEEIVCQCAPEWWSMARRTFHVQQFAIYFALMIGAHQVYHYSGGGNMGTGMVALAWQVSLSAVTLGILTGLAAVYARTTVYTITNRRIVLRFGVAVPMMINLPLERVKSGDLRAFGDGTGDIALRLEDGEWVSYWALWPHARPWHFSPVLPTLRNVPQASEVAAQLAAVVAASSQVAVAPTRVDVNAEYRADARAMDRAGALA